MWSWFNGRPVAIEMTYVSNFKIIYIKKSLVATYLAYTEEQHEKPCILKKVTTTFAKPVKSRFEPL